MQKFYMLILLSSSLLLGCQADKYGFEGEVLGYKPIYRPSNEIKEITLKPAKKLQKAGKIYATASNLFIIEPTQGIHIFDNTDKKNPINKGFLQVPLVQDVEMKGSVLYADNGTDLVAIDLSKPTDPKVLSRIENVFPMQNFPPQRGVRFECVDPTKGYVIGWEQTKLVNPRCRR